MIVFALPPPIARCLGWDRRMCRAWQFTPSTKMCALSMLQRDAAAATVQHDEQTAQADVDAMPGWASKKQDVQVWWNLPNCMGVDECAKMALFNLAQHNEDGYQAAYTLVDTLIEKMNCCVALRSPSGFVFSTVLNARHQLDV